jgi:hypothetical protein
MKKNRGKGVIYPTRMPEGGFWQRGSHVVTVNKDGSINYQIILGFSGNKYCISRQEARLLARRLLQALEDTK